MINAIKERFGVRIMREKTFQRKISAAEIEAVREAKRAEIRRKHRDAVERYRKAPVLIQEVSLMSIPKFTKEFDYQTITRTLKFSPAIYRVAFKFEGFGDEVKIDLEFEDYDVSISDIQRAIQAKICGGGCDE